MSHSGYVKIFAMHKIHHAVYSQYKLTSPLQSQTLLFNYFEKLANITDLLTILC